LARAIWFAPAEERNRLHGTCSDVLARVRALPSKAMNVAARDSRRVWDGNAGITTNALAGLRLPWQ
jgi:hypothetical protein